MPRGIYNRKKKEEAPKDDALRVGKPIGHALAVKEEKFDPKPDMGSVKPPAQALKECKCGHQKNVHYGPHTDWCNTDKCDCQRFNEK